MINSLGANKEKPTAVQRVTGKKTHMVQGSHKIDNYSLGWKLAFSTNSLPQ